MMTRPFSYLVVSCLIALSSQGCVLIQSFDEAEMDEEFDMARAADMFTLDVSLDLGLRDEEMSPDLAEPADQAPDLTSSTPVATLSIDTDENQGLRTVVNTPLSLRVDARDANNTPTSCAPTWQVFPPHYGTITGEGLLTPINTGELTAIAECDGVQAMARIESLLPEVTTQEVELITWLVADRGIARDRDEVTAWKNAHNDVAFTALLDSARPLYLERVPELNDFSAIDFSADFLQQDGSTLLADELSIFTVVRGTKMGENNHIAGWCNNADIPDHGNHLFYFDKNGNYEFNSKATIEGNGIDDRSEYFMSTTPSIWHVRSLVVSAQTVTLHEDGELITEQPPKSAPLRFRMNNIGGWCAGSSANRFTGQMAELLFFQGALSALEREAIEAYLMQKYNL